ncbi:AAA family ATPase [Lyngbya aestuarii]|uniref:AAA family ATPase n=1 Tax=Lyngbya aestuarii TaxID=118322 RepID=UPI00403E237D
MNRNDEWEWVQIPNGERAAVAKYTDQKLPEYNSNPLIQALPPIFSPGEFARRVARLPQFHPQERELERHYRFHCIERLSRYFDPQNRSVELQQQICVLIMEGYLGRNLLNPEYARRSRQIYQAIVAGDGKNLDKYVNVPTSASSLTLIGPSGIGKTTNLINILNLYPQVILHRDHSVYQLVWLKVDCPHAGSLKGLCTDIFLAADRLLGTNYFKKFGSKGNSEDYMLAQVAQLAHTQHLGVLIVDEMQNLAKARRGRDELLNFLVKMDNIIGVPVIRAATNEAFPIFQGNFRNARRAIGKAGVVWDRMLKDKDREWEHFLKGMWEYQWTKVFVPITEKINREEKINERISEAFYEECQGIIDIAIKLYKMVQWRAISLGSEEITVELIHQVAEEGLQMVKPMLDAIRSGKQESMQRYGDIAPLDTTEYYSKCLSELKSRELEEIRKLAQKQQSRGNVSATLSHVILKLMELDVEPALAKECAEKVVAAKDEDMEIPSLVKEAYTLALQGGQSKENPTKPNKRKTKPKPKYQDNDIRLLVENAKKAEKPAYVYLELAGIIKSPVEDFIKLV